MKTTGRKSEKLLIVAAMIGYLLYLGARRVEEKLEREGNVTAHSGRAIGVNTFYRLREELQAGTTKLLQSPFFEPGALDPQARLFIFSPTRGISRGEIKALRTFLEQGGELLLGFHDQHSHAAVDGLLYEFEFTDSVQRDASFENYRALEITARSEIDPFQPHLTYGFYGTHQFERDDCRSEAWSCRVQTKSIGQGRVVVIASLPPLANAMMTIAANRDFVLRAALDPRPLLIDEYHHFYANKELADLLLEPSFFMPLGGLALLVLLYFVYGDFARQLPRPSEQTPPRSYHDFNLGLITSQLRKKMAAAEAASLVRALIANRHRRESAALQEEASLEELLEQHVRILESKGSRIR